MARKRKGPTKTAIHVNLPITMIQDVDEVCLNRSKFISQAVQAKLNGSKDSSISDASAKRLLIALSSRIDELTDAQIQRIMGWIDCI